MSFVRQLSALIWKNFLFTIVRHPVGFILKCYGIPLVICALLIQLPIWVTPIHDFKSEAPAAIASLSDGITGKLAIIRPPHPGADIQRVIDKFTEPLSKSNLLYLDNDEALITACSKDTDGCHASVSFADSPETKAGNGTWNYTIRSDAGLWGKHTGGVERVYMPLQLAINNAITNSSQVPEAFAFGQQSTDIREVREQARNTITGIYLFVVFATHLVVVYNLASWITSDRDCGVSSLVDSMGGRWVSLARTLSWVLVLDVVCMPLYIAYGILYWQLLFPTSSAGPLIGWQILLGLSLNSSTVFAAAFFKRARASAIVICIVFLGLAVASQFFTTRPFPKPAPDTVRGLSLLFPSCGYTLYMFIMARWENQGVPASLSAFPPPPSDSPDVFVITQGAILGALALQSIVYLCFGLVAEWFMHGISFKNRDFSPDSSKSGAAAVSAKNLKKKFRPDIWDTIFYCGRRKPNVAVDDVTIEAHRGQIMCLVGQNGSGKTTTLQMIGGFLGMDAGQASFDASASQIGICPQKNIYWEELTVREHIVLWSGIKSGGETAEQIDELIADCDLAHKSDCLAKNLSGGQKRKLQLACMFVGNSSTCLIDECTSGLDPLSRQAIWDLLLRNRAGRSMIFTTHFLDEVDVLADHIVVLHKGKVKCQGSPAELNTTHGGGYKVIVERNPKSLAVMVPQEATVWQDRLVYEVGDSVAATQLSNKFSSAGVHDVVIAGPQFEDVFLNLAGEDGDSSLLKPPSLNDSHSQLTPGRETSFGRQVWILFAKRFKVLPRVWWPYFFICAIVIAADFGMVHPLTKYKTPPCSDYAPQLDPAYRMYFYYDDHCITFGSDYCDKIIVSPPSANSSMFNLVKDGYADMRNINATAYNAGFVTLLDNRKTWMDTMRNSTQWMQNGIYFGSGKDGDASVIAYGYTDYISNAQAPQILNIWSQATSNMEIDATFGSLPEISKNSGAGGWIFVIFYALVQAAYPAFFVVYPAIERRSKTRSLQYANGVRRTPHMVAYMLFDFFWIAVMSVVSSATLFPASGWTGSPWVMIVIFGLHGICGTFIAQIVGHVSNGPLKSFLASLTVSLILYAIGMGAFLGTSTKATDVISGVSWGLGLFLPIGNLIRAMMVGFNIAGLGCSNGVMKSEGSMDAYGGPILYLVIQVIALGTLSVWTDGGLPYIPLLSFRKRKASPTPADSASTELRNLAAGQDDVRAEALRTTQHDTDPLRVLNVTKRFGSNTAVSDVTFGLSPGEVLALLGPNGAGKSTLVNMIQSEFASTAGEIYLCGTDARSLSARKYLGVCPQHDSLDLLTTRQHLTLYARIRGVHDVKANVAYLLERLDLLPHARTMAAKLSGGNKRKLSLAIALMGMPPVLVLDEPTTAMDAMAKRSFWRIVESIASDHSILLTTHSMEEADRLASRTAIMASRMLAIGSTTQLRNKYGGGYSVSLTLRSAPESSQEEMQNVLDFIRARAQGTVALERDMLRGQIRFTMKPHEPATAKTGGDERQPAAIALWNLLDESKEPLGIQFYSIGGATLANAFMNVVRANNVREENSEANKKTIGQFLKNLL